MRPVRAANCRVRAGSGAHRHRHRFHRRRAAGCHRRCGQRSDRQPFRSRDRRTRHLSHSGARRRLQITAELSGFTTASRSGVQVWSARPPASTCRWRRRRFRKPSPSPAEAPLINVTTSSLGGNIDPQQVQELPVQGRNWMALALLAPGSRTVPGNAQAPLPDRNSGEVREFQLNIDGQQISSELGTGGQPRFSQDSIAEFQFISNRFDATQGRSSRRAGERHHASRAPTRYPGLFRAQLPRRQLQRRRSRWSAACCRSATSSSARRVGGPIVRDKLHYFGNFEYERAPRASIWTTPYPAFNFELQREVLAQDRRRRGSTTRSLEHTRLMGKLSGSERLRRRSALGRQPSTRRQRSTPTNTTASILAR